jgi:polyphosphate kinase
LSKSYPYINRDVSWLSFNYRVLQEAKDLSLPLLDRIKFLAIYSNNLDEFFRVRIANHRNLVRAGKSTSKQLDFEPKVVLTQLLRLVNKQQEEFSQIFGKQIVPELKKYGVHLIRRKEMNREQQTFVNSFFDDHVILHVQPLLLVKDKIKLFLNNGALYLAIILHDKEKSDPKPEYAIVQIPTKEIDRFILLPEREEGRTDVIMLDDIMRHCVKSLFPGYNIQDSFSIKLTRDAELYIDDEFSGDLIEKIRSSISRRKVGLASRLVYDWLMPDHLLKYLSETLQLSDYDLLPEGRYHNNSDFFKFPKFDLLHLEEAPLPPIPVHEMEDSDSIFDAIKEKDQFIHVPYHTYESVIRLFEDSAKDPNVTHIKIVQYRVASVSRIMAALMAAVKAGKQVSAFIEVKARFDEEANLIWGEKLEKAGVTVHYSMPGLKVHAKMALIRRLENNIPVLYSYFSTGNFHEGTAKIYSDVGIFTTDKRLTREAARVFSYLETRQQVTHNFEHLLVGQFNLFDSLMDFIQREIDHKKAGKKARIILKMNSLQDQKIIDRLYEASQAGVKIKLIVRGICSLVPGVKGISENIEAISIVDRFLEHARVFIFHNGGDEKIYISSADWMVRNLHHRVETIIPIYDEQIREQIKMLIDIQLNDNVKARMLNHKRINEYRKDDSDMAIRSQLETYYYIKRLAESKSLVSEDTDGVPESI